MKTVTSFSGALLASTMFIAPSAVAQQAEATAEQISQDTIVVRGQFIPEPQRQTAQVASFVTNEDLLRSGDGDAAIALTRVSGLSVVGGRFAYVRGLGDRYSSALLNGSPLPSPEPLRRTVPLDLFPSGVLDRIAVQKTYSANYQGEFGGGLIDLRTLRRPVENFINLSTSIGYNTETTLEDGLFHHGSDQDWTGWDGGLRDLPGPLQAVVNSGTRLNSLTDAQIEAAGESLVNSPLTVIQQGELGPDSSVNLEGGYSTTMGDWDVGLIGAAGYSQGWETQRATRQFVLGGIIGNEFQTTESALDVQTNALGSISFDNGDHLIQATGFYVHSTSKESQIDTGRDFNAPGATGQVFDESTGWYERSLGMFQLAGEHFFNDFEVRWRGSIAQATRDAPYERSLRRFPDPVTGVPAYLEANNYSIRFSELTDDLTHFGIDVQRTFQLPESRELVLMAGFDTARTERDYDFLAFRFAGGNSLPADVQVARPDFLFGPDNIDPNRFVLLEVTTPNDSYAANLDVDAFYAQADFDITNYIRATVGVRAEQGDTNVQTFDRFGTQGARAAITEDYVLPALTVTWNFADDLQMRAGYSETIARPQFRELARSSFFDPESERIYRGNSGLVDSRLQNFDARLEYYMGRDQFITGAVFYKRLENPIEEVQFSTSTFVFETTFINSPEAVVQGLELEFRRYFTIPVENGPFADFFADRDFRFSVNYTYTDSEVQADANDTVFDPITSTARPASVFGLDGSVLQGTPEHIANAQIGWESDNEQLTLLLNWVDERVLQRGLTQPGAELPDVLEDPGYQLDLTYRRDFQFAGRDLTFGVSARNLLNEDHIEFQRNPNIGVTQFNSYERGTSLSASLTARF
ncbi:TonB-dependent receptor domain-containing protein [Hyphobacterium sp.]|uniref:TonB-dependent receptor domain-containing protein n=1 Tax=Hyphobacterium sp. TaxID=2004662 RepID=UPI003BADA6ED